MKSWFPQSQFITLYNTWDFHCILILLIFFTFKEIFSQMGKNHALNKRIKNLSEQFLLVSNPWTPSSIHFIEASDIYDRCCWLSTMQAFSSPSYFLQSSILGELWFCFNVHPIINPRKVIPSLFPGANFEKYKIIIAFQLLWSIIGWSSGMWQNLGKTDKRASWLGDFI